MDDLPEENNINNNGEVENAVPPDNGPWYCSFCNWMGSFYSRFDGPFITFFIIQYMNHGLWEIVTLAVKDYYKEYMNIDPGDMQFYISLKHLPWSFKMIYGLISDNVPIFGSKRKSWLIIMGLVQVSFMFILFAVEPMNPIAVTLLLVGVSLSEAFTNVVADAIMVIQSRKDPAFGCQDLVTLGSMSQAIGGIIGSVAGGVMTEVLHPKWCFLIFSIFGLFISAFAACLSKDSERDASELEQELRESLGNIAGSDRDSQSQLSQAGQVQVRSGFCYNLGQYMKALGRAITMKQIYLLIFFILLYGLLNPTFKEFFYYFLLNEDHISKFTYSMIDLTHKICHIVGAILYKTFFRTANTRVMLFMSFVAASVGAFCMWAFALQWNLDIGMPNVVALFTYEAIFYALNGMLFDLPIQAFFAKITPKNVEGTIYATLTGILSLAQKEIQPGMGVFINHKIVGAKYSTLCLIQLISGLFTFVLLPLIPSKSSVSSYRQDRTIQYNAIKEARKEAGREQKKKQRQAQEEEKEEEEL